MLIQKKFFIKSLKQIDLEILYWTVQDKSPEKVADILSAGGDPDKAITASTVNYHLGKIYDRFGVEGEGREKRENLIRQWQRDVMELFPTPEDLQKHIRVALIPIDPYDVLHEYVRDIAGIEIFSEIEIHKDRLKLVVKEEYTKEFFERFIEMIGGEWMEEEDYNGPKYVKMIL